MSTPSPKPASKAELLDDPTNDLKSIRHFLEMSVVAALDPVRAAHERAARMAEYERTRPAREAQMLEWFGVEKCATMGIFPPAPAAPAAAAPEPIPVPE